MLGDKIEQHTDQLIDQKALLGDAVCRAAADLETRTDFGAPPIKRAAIERGVNELLVVYHGDDHLLVRAKIDQLNEATQTLAENMMNTAVRGALKGTNING